MQFLKISSFLLALCISAPCFGQISGRPGGHGLTRGGYTGFPPPTPPPGNCADFDYCPASYTAARAQTCSVGETALITDPNGEDGSWDCVVNSQAWRSGPVRDDGGINLATGTAGNTWKRDFAHTEGDPIELNWYEWIADHARIDTFYNNLISDMGNIYTKMPSSVVTLDTLNWQDGYDFGNTAQQFYMLESNQKVNIVHTGATESVTMFLVDNYTHVKIGGVNFNMKFHGKHPGASCAYPLSGTQTCGEQLSETISTPTDGAARGLITLDQRSTNGVLVDIRADAKDCDSYCVYSIGGGDASSQRTQNVHIEGFYDNGGLSVNGGVVHAFTSLTATDPHAAGQGWLGTTYPSNNGCTSNYEKNKAMVRVHDADTWRGDLVLRYGWAKWFSVDVDSVGRPNDRFDIQYDSLGWTGPSAAIPGEQVATAGCVMQGGKPDPWFQAGATAAPTRFMRITEQAGSNFALNDEIRMVATSSAKSWTTCCTDIEFNGMQGPLSMRVEGNTDTVRDHIVRGGATANTGVLEQIGMDYTVAGGEWCNIEIANSDIRGRPPTTNTIQDLTVSAGAGCYIEFKHTPTGTTTIDNITFNGSARAVIQMDASGSYTVDVPSDGKLTAPSGSTITNPGGGATLVCSGNTQSLPYTFDGATDDCED